MVSNPGNPGYLIWMYQYFENRDNKLVNISISSRIKNFYNPINKTIIPLKILTLKAEKSW